MRSDSSGRRGRAFGKPRGPRRGSERSAAPADADADADADTDGDSDSVRVDGSDVVSPAEREKPEPPDAYTKALGLLVRREHSRRELERKLSAKGIEPDLAGTALDRLGEQGYQDDARFAEMLVRTRITRGHGPLRIRADLGVHHIDPDTSSQVLSQAEPDWTALAVDALRRRFGDRAAVDQAERVKRANFLMRRGFTGDSIRAALKPTDD